MKPAVVVFGDFGGGFFFAFGGGVESTTFDNEEIPAADGSDLHLEGLVVIDADQPVA